MHVAAALGLAGAGVAGEPGEHHAVEHDRAGVAHRRRLRVEHDAATLGAAPVARSSAYSVRRAELVDDDEDAVAVDRRRRYRRPAAEGRRLGLELAPPTASSPVSALCADTSRRMSARYTQPSATIGVLLKHRRPVRPQHPSSADVRRADRRSRRAWCAGVGQVVAVATATRRPATLGPHPARRWARASAARPIGETGSRGRQRLRRPRGVGASRCPTASPSKRREQLAGGCGRRAAGWTPWAPTPARVPTSVR